MYFISVKTEIFILKEQPKIKDERLTINKQFLGAIFVNLLNSFGTISKF